MNTYCFDYRLVLAEDPSFEKFVDIDRSEFELDTRRRPIEREQTTRYRGYYGAEAESDIIDFVHDGSATKKNALEDAQWTDMCKAFPDEIIEKVTIKKEYENPPNPNFDPSILALPVPNRFLLSESKVWQDEDTLYIFSRGIHFDESKFISSFTKYRFAQSEDKIRLFHTSYRFDRKKNVTRELKKNFHMLIYNTTTKQIYRLIKQKSSKKSSSHFKTKIENVFYILTRNSSSSGTPERLQKRFVDAITKAAIKDVPNLVIPRASFISNDPPTTTGRSVMVNLTHIEEISEREFRTLKLLAIILQHKVGQPMPWLNDILMRNMWYIMSDTKYYRGVLNLQLGKDTDAAIRIRKSIETAESIRKKTVFKVVPNLRKSNHMKTVVKTLLGDHYHHFFLKLFNVVWLEAFLSNWLRWSYNGTMRKNIYHWLVQSINSNNIVLLKAVIKLIRPVLEYFVSEEPSQQEISIIDSYVKMCQKMLKNPESIACDNWNDTNLLNWRAWRDLFNMASQIGIRIRPNKFKNFGEVRNIHDKLSAIVRRDIRILRKYENVVFEEFANPNKEYDGFKFLQLRTAKELRHEGTVMHHCVASYANKCVEGSSIIFSMRKDDKSYVTIDVNPRTYEISQKYTLHDITVTSQAVLDLIDEWRSDYLKLHQDEEESYYDRCQRKIKEVTFKNKVEDLKEMVAEGIIDSDAQLLNQIRKYEEAEYA